LGRYHVQLVGSFEDWRGIKGWKLTRIKQLVWLVGGIYLRWQC